MKARLCLFVKLFIFILNTTIVLSADDKCAKNPTENENQPTKEELIKEHILCDYDKTMRPVIDGNGTKMTFVVVAEKVNFMDYSSAASLEATIVIKWRDEHLFWDPSEFDDTKEIYIDAQEIWIPDLSVYNKRPYATKKFLKSDTKCLVYYNKNIICVFENSIHAMCTPDFRHWPYDVQNCTIKIGSWYHTGSEIDFSFTSIKKDMSLYRENLGWHLQSLSMKVDPGIYKNFPNDTFPSIKINFVINRRIAHLFITIMVPFFVLVSLTLMTFWMDPRSSDRIYMSVLNIPCHILFLFQCQWEVPEGGNSIPYLILYLRNSNLLSSIILIETMIVRYLLEKTNESPAWLLSVTTKIGDNRIGKFLLFKEFNTNDVDNEIGASEESGTLVEIKEKPSEWYLLGRLIDKFVFIITVAMYFISFLICIT